MVRRCFAILVVILALALAGAAAARRRHQIDATPFSHAPCSVLEGRPCTPSFCSVFNHGPCIPEIDYPYGENLQLTVQTLPPKDEAAKYVRPDHDLDTIGDLFAELRSCPSRAAGRCGARGDADVGAFQLQAVWRDHRRTALDLRHRGVSPDIRETYLKAINASLDGCVPLKFTGGLGGALAGRPIAIRYVDNRELDQPTK